MTHGADATSWLLPAQAFSKHGAFVDLDDPNQPHYYRPPGITLFIATALGIGGETRTVVYAQIILLALTAIMVGLVASKLAPGSGPWASALYVLNPNVASTALLLQSETLFTALIVAAIAVYVWFTQRQTLVMAIALGTLLAAATLVRPTAQYLLLVLPLALMLSAIFHSEQPTRIGRCFLYGCISALIGVALLFPWASFVQQHEGRYSTTSAEIEYRYIWDQVVILEAHNVGQSYQEAGRVLDGLSVAGVDADMCRALPLATVDRANCFSMLSRAGFARMASYDGWIIVTSLVRSAAAFLITGGAGNWTNLFDLGRIKANKRWMDADQGSVVEVVRAMVGALGGIAALVTVICIGFAIALKLFAAWGIVVLIRRAQWGAVLLIIAIVVYFFGTTLFLGQSRYRMPTEPVFTIAAAIGILFLKNYFAATRLRKKKPLESNIKT